MTKKLALVLAVLMVLGLCLTACQSTPATSDPTQAPADTAATEAPKADATQAPATNDDKKDDEPAKTDDQPTTEPGAIADDPNFNPSGWPIVKEQESIHVLCSRSTYAPEDLNELYILQQAEAITNVHVNFESYTDTTYTEKLNIILASGTYPDVISNGMNALRQAQYGMQQHILIDQNELIDTYMVELQRLFDEKPALRAYSTSADGCMYALPELNEGGWMQNGNNMIINQSWMDELDLEMPTTLDEFKEVLKAFKENDCNGNGDATDEVPLYTLLNLVGYNSANTGLQHFFGSFGVDMNTNYWDADEKGNVFFTGTTEEYKNAVKWLRDLAKEGLLSTLGFSSDWDTFRAAFNQEPYVYGTFGIWEIGDGFTSPNGPIEYEFLKPLKGLNGEDPVFGVNKYPGYNPSKWAITVDCKKPYLLARYGDYYYQKDVSLTCIEGAIDGPNPRLVPCTICNNGRALMVNTDIPEGQTILQFRDQNFAAWFPWGVTREYYDERLHLHFTDRKVNYIDHDLKPYADQYTVPGTLMFTVEEAELVNQIQSDIRDYCNRKGVEWVMGDADIDAEWDSYCNELKAMRVDEYIAAAQAAYTRFQETMAKYAK